MDIITNLMHNKGGELMAELANKGFTPTQAQAFLPEALSGILDSAKQQNLGQLLSMATPEKISAILAGLNLQDLAAKTGIDSTQASHGVQALIPKVLEFIKSNNLLAGLGGVGRLAGLAQGLFK